MQILVVNNVNNCFWPLYSDLQTCSERPITQEAQEQKTCDMILTAWLSGHANAIL